jgi:hypothetical protein
MGWGFFSQIVAGCPARQRSGLREEADYPSNHRLVHIAPTPILARLKRLDDRVTGRVEMLSRVPVWRGIAAADMAAGEAQAQMYPPTADPQAIFAAVSTRSDLSNEPQMWIRHFFLLFGSHAAVHLGVEQAAAAPCRSFGGKRYGKLVIAAEGAH